MGTPTPLRSPYGNAPENLAPPVPETDPTQNFINQVTQVRIPQVEDRAHVPANETPLPPDFSDLEQELDRFSALDSVLDGGDGGPAVDGESYEVDEGSSVFGINTDFRQQASDFAVRVQANLAENPEAQFATLQKSLGEKNVKKTADGILFRKEGEKKFRKLDPGTFEVLNDVFADFYRETIEGIGGTVGAIAGAAGGTAAAPGVGTAAGATAGFGLGTAAGSAFADVLGESLLGVQRPDYAPGLEGVGQRTVHHLEKGAYAAVFKGLADKFFGGGQKIKEIKKMAEVPKGETLTEGVRQNLDTLEDLRKLGYTRKIGGTDIEVPAHQLVPHLPKVQALATSVADEKAFQQMQNVASENIHNTALDLVEEAADLSRGNLRQVVKTGVPVAKQVDSAQINGLFNSVRKAEGALLEQFRNKARVENVKRFALPAPQTRAAMDGIFQNLGVRTANESGKVRLVFPDDDSLAQLLGTDSKAFINGFKKDLTHVYSRMLESGGGFHIDDLLAQSKLIGAKNEGARRVGGLYKKYVGQLSSALRADSREQMSKLLDPEDAVEYAAKMKRFSSIAGSMDQLSSFLNDDIGMNIFAKGLVNKGKQGLANLRAAKEFLLQEDPDTYKALIGEYFEELAMKHRDPKTVGGFNAEGMRRELATLGSEYLDELFPRSVGTNKGLVLRTFDLANQLEKSLVRNAPDDQLLKEGQQILAKMGWAAGKVGAVSALLRFGTTNSRMMKLLSREGVESFIKDVPKAQKGPMRKTLEAALAVAKENGVLQTARFAGQNVPYTATAGGVQRVKDNVIRPKSKEMEEE